MSHQIMKRTLFICLGILATGGAVLGVVANQHEPVCPPNAKVGTVNVAGLKPDEVKAKLKSWWGAMQMDKITFTSASMQELPQPMSPAEAGLKLDIDATVAQIKLETFPEAIGHKVGVTAPAVKYPVIWTYDDARIGTMTEFVKQRQKPKRKASVRYENGAVQIQHELPGVELDVEKYKADLLTAALGDEKMELPMKEGKKSMPDELLNKIKEPMVTFSTHFPYNPPRMSNIKLASSKINGIILMPGQIFSYNDTVGRRTIEAGFRLAGVYKNGRHDTGIGGGICQVSTTLYNAALLSNLKIVARQNHSLPVAYVPPGRDATVDYGSIDLKLQNTYDFPIAICSKYVPGQLTFTILGQKDPSLAVKIVSGGVHSWGMKTQTIPDRNLPAGKVVVVEKGSGGRSVSTWRYIYKNGQLVKKESLGTSTYNGGTRIVRRGTGAPRAPKPKPAAGAPTDSKKPVTEPISKPG